MRPASIGVVVLLSLGAIAGAAAHQMNLTTARIEVSADRTVRVELALKGSDVDRAAGTRVFDERTGLVEPGRLAAAAAPIAAYLAAHAAVTGADGTPCAAAPVRLAPDRDGVVAHMGWSCGRVGGGLVYRSTVLVDVEPAARQVALIGSGPEAAQALLDAERTSLRLDAPPPALGQVIARYVRAGVEHIFLGYDHVAFLIAVVLWARRLLPVIKIVTAFTVAHSITLSLAALNVVTVPSAVVEPAITASIVFVAVENFFSHEVRRRWRDTFGFGLIHGFGFASALQEFGLPPGSVVPALAGFNLGVELGQVAIVALVVPALVGLDRVFARSSCAKPERPAPLVHVLSGAVALLGCYWIAERTFLA